MTLMGSAAISSVRLQGSFFNGDLPALHIVLQGHQAWFFSLAI